MLTKKAAPEYPSIHSVDQAKSSLFFASNSHTFIDSSLVLIASLITIV